MSFAAALILAASAAPQAVSQAPATVSSPRASATATASATIISAARIRFDEEPAEPVAANGDIDRTYRQRRSDGRRPRG